MFKWIVLAISGIGVLLLHSIWLRIILIVIIYLCGYWSSGGGGKMLKKMTPTQFYKRQRYEDKW